MAELRPENSGLNGLNLPVADHRSAGNLVFDFLRDTIETERRTENRSRELAATVHDDDEVQRCFVAYAEQTRAQRRRLTQRFEQLGGSAATVGNDADPVADAGVDTDSHSKVAEERTLQNLIAGYTLACREFATYEALAALAQSIGDHVTESLAREIQAEERASATQIWHFLPSRSKIAFNMLTISEVDPSVETKVADNRLLES